MLKKYNGRDNNGRKVFSHCNIYPTWSSRYCLFVCLKFEDVQEGGKSRRGSRSHVMQIALNFHLSELPVQYRHLLASAAVRGAVSDCRPRLRRQRPTPCIGVQSHLHLWSGRAFQDASRQQTMTRWCHRPRTEFPNHPRLSSCLPRVSAAGVRTCAIYFRQCLTCSSWSAPPLLPRR